jgi:hypothetical protein
MKKCAAEFFGTFCLVFAGTSAIVVNAATGGTITHAGVALVFGLVVLAMIYTVGDVSGAHLNPAVTIGFYAAGRLEFGRVFPYIASQIAGAIAASAAVRAILPNEAAARRHAPVRQFDAGLRARDHPDGDSDVDDPQRLDRCEREGDHRRYCCRRGRRARGAVRGASLRRVDEPGAFVRPSASLDAP